MIRKTKGFTLIELLIVVAIIGILAALLIPNIMSAIQRGRQKGTMGDMHTLATNLTDYITENTQFPTPITSLTDVGNNLDFLLGFYARRIPQRDKWGNPLQVALGLGASDRGYPLSGTMGPDEFMLCSYGRDGNDDGWTFDNQTTYGDDDTADFYEVNDMSDFTRDIVIINGDFAHAPASAVGTGT
jgi:general secretion pathway protein G